ncbi:MAG: hypothetical protein JNG90_09280 [Planctomycetaceae bacterium]|nr:hypothetical protein [Planctomycetaceae bacterium]
MNRRARVLGWIGGALAVAGLALTAGTNRRQLRGDDAGATAAADRLIVHEWGTFTSFAGSDGVQLEFRPLVTHDLPGFVFGVDPSLGPWGSAIPLLVKKEYVALQRMETPVTYFYTDRERVVNARVDFPRGLLSEWFPQVQARDPGKQGPQRQILGGSYLDWGAVRLTPAGDFAQVRVRNTKGEIVPASLPRVNDDDHYGRARETDSAIVETVDSHGASHFEKFLFYRGLGNFDLPIKLAALGNERFEISNASPTASGALLLLRIEDERVRFTRVASIGPETATEVTLPAATTTIDAVAEATVRELIAAGLYEKEALAMVNTWRTSWFGEAGTRLLYLVSSQLTDELLPLRIEPAPEEQVRVLVGRLETLTPEDCRALTATLTGADGREPPAPERIRAELQRLGRFAEPALKYAGSQTSDPVVRDRLAAILAEHVRAPTPGASPSSP